MTIHEDKQWEGGMLGSFASFVFLDFYYTKTLPMTQVISGAFDTLSHCYETYLGSPRVPNLSDQIDESVMRVAIKNMRKLKVHEQDFQAHQIEHRLGAYTDCNHDQGLPLFIQYFIVIWLKKDEINLHVLLKKYGKWMISIKQNKKWL